MSEPTALPRRTVADPTGDESVDAALAELDGVDDLAPAAQLPVLTAVHEALQQRLSSTEA